ncbi:MULTISPECIES: hypothetical protein [unclassified Nonomuraea]|uniref:hypothetical protein n=1 Tax=unclassified Nonomuraea TaxID=2593643 RepID=UPI0033DAD555
MSIKDAALQFGTAIENKLIQARADQMELGQQLTERINSVANQVKILDGKVTALDSRVTALDTKVEVLSRRFTTMEGTMTTMQQTQFEMRDILVAIQSKLELN